MGEEVSYWKLTNSVLDRFHSYLPMGSWARGALYCSWAFSASLSSPTWLDIQSTPLWLLSLLLVPVSRVTKDVHVAQSNGFVQAFVNWHQCSCWPTWPLTAPWNMLPGAPTIQYQFSFYLFGCPTSSYFKVSGTCPTFFAFFTIDSLLSNFINLYDSNTINNIRRQFINSYFQLVLHFWAPALYIQLLLKFFSLNISPEVQTQYVKNGLINIKKNKYPTYSPSIASYFSKYLPWGCSCREPKNHFDYFHFLSLWQI